ncbi:MAG: family 20 glycosylhydrolase [Phycisphaerae bacterium]|nr:family 20 glycosylhydrolase [Phycisphaerae bacterium]
MSTIRIKGVMMDMARVTERHEYYFALPDRLAGWGYNTIFAHFTDDEGCAMQFARRPELATPHAFSQDEMRRWVATAAAAGLDVIPELESFGHTAFIHGRKKYASLREPTQGIFNAINPLARETRAILRDLVEETAGVFRSPYIHAGLDEVNFGGSSQVLKALKRRKSWELFADHVNLMHDLITGAGRKMMMWGDHLLHEPEIAGRISTDIVICDWHYQADVQPTTVEFFTSRGFQVIVSPASNRSGDMVMPNATTQINLQRFSRIAHDVAAKPKGRGRVIGLMNTVWCPMRMLCGIEQFAMALGGAWFSDPAAEPVAAVARFVRSQFGVKKADDVAAAILRLSAVMPGRVVLRRMMDSEALPAGPITACEAANAGKLFEEAVALGERIATRGGEVTRNAAEYENLELASELLAWAALVAISRLSTNGSRAKLRRALLSEGRRLLKRCQADWNRGRYANDPMRDLDGQPGRWPDALIPNLHLALSRLGS